MHPLPSRAPDVGIKKRVTLRLRSALEPLRNSDYNNYYVNVFMCSIDVAAGVLYTVSGCGCTGGGQAIIIADSNGNFVVENGQGFNNFNGCTSSSSGCPLYTWTPAGTGVQTYSFYLLCITFNRCRMTLNEL